MPAWNREVVTTRVVRFRVPAVPYGADWTDLYSAVTAAIQELRTAKLCEPDRDPAADAIRVFPGDEDIIVEITVPDGERRTEGGPVTGPRVPAAGPTP